MNDTTPGRDDSPDPMRSLLKRFESRFAGNPRFRIEDLLSDTSDRPSSEDLGKLIQLEIELRNRSNQPLDRWEYRERFINHWPQIDSAFERIDEIDVVFSSFAPTETDSDEEIGVLEGGCVDIPQKIGPYEIHAKLGKGNFGIVFRAVDTRSGQTVALKFPRRRVIESQRELEMFLQEAALARSLEHPGIVTTFGAEQIDGMVFIVQQSIDGDSLSSLVGAAAPAETIVHILADVADAVTYAHQHGFVHRDLKPSNILLDRQGHPYVADFGLAMHESSKRMLRGERCGARAYMSPELVQGLSHQLDGRSDIWTLGVIMYYLLTGRRPFDGNTNDELYEEIKNVDPPPLRARNPQIDVELERICLCCLNKRKADRYLTADRFAADLRAWLDELVHVGIPAPIIPKGLRSYDREDAEFFLQLLPGPKDKNGLPESIRFWKSRIEQVEGAGSFPIGVIFGPSGCGKSSFIKAGLLPSLDKRQVRPIYVESTAGDTEVRLMKAIRGEFADVPEKISLPRLLHAVKEKLWSPRDKRVLIVLDQFEQWLYSADKEQESQLMEALRHCDGRSLQCIVTVRDDFWVKISTFVNALDVNLSEGENVRRLDRFSLDHARHILAEFGRAYGRLPNDLTQLTKEQNAFLDEAIAQLSEEDRVICVRLALSAEMFKDRPWTVGELKRVGGISGIGETFLEATFHSESAPPRYRRLADSARAVLESLLPEPGNNLRGHIASEESLRESSGLANTMPRFCELMEVLDGDLRLVTPTSPDKAESIAGYSMSGVESNYYQLTHDYLVPSIRGWLTRNLRKTWQGRAKLRLESYAADWMGPKESRVLPALIETTVMAIGVPQRLLSHHQSIFLKTSDSTSTGALHNGCPGVSYNRYRCGICMAGNRRAHQKRESGQANLYRTTSPSRIVDSQRTADIRALGPTRLENGG